MDVLMPQLGETVAEGKISTWFKQVGDTVKPGDNLFEIETDKVSMEVPATTAGVIAEIRVRKGEIAPVGAIVAVIVGEGGAAAVSATVARSDASPPIIPARAGIQSPAALSSRLRGDERRNEPAPPVRRSPAGPLDPFHEVRTPERNFGAARLPGGVAVTPLARRIAGEGGIDLSTIKGSGPHGRIVARDVETATPRIQITPPAAGRSASHIMALYRGTPFEEIPLDAMRRTIASRLIEAKQTVPHFYLTLDAVIDDLLKVREEANAVSPKDKDGGPAFKLSVNDFVIKALALALQRVPQANVVWAEDRVLRFGQSDIGVAVAIDGGLITPVIRKAESKSLGTISTEMRDLASRARARKLMPEDYQGGSSAISNLGMYGIREFAAIINPPHATILAVGAAQRCPIEAADGGVAFATQMTLTLSCDHRVVDGAVGAQLLAACKGFIEQPVTMLV
ncbi:MAG: 2-oxo acid dehydrogenase subunit E2 [Rhizobiales bacterium]|nr:2-oxo acid dehydrogenase subunit E2 [Hyphomicrobiales bacterium]